MSNLWKKQHYTVVLNLFQDLDLENLDAGPSQRDGMTKFAKVLLMLQFKKVGEVSEKCDYQ